MAISISQRILCSTISLRILETYQANTYQVAVPSSIINIASWGYLAYVAADTSTRALFVTALLITGSGPVFAWTLLRAINGALSIRAENIVGPYGNDPISIALTYSKNESRTKSIESKTSTRDLVSQWISLNSFRAALMTVGCILGAYGLVTERK